jgi:GntR family transcriptional regulator, vanillate catabolism transcriptional regulator
MFDQRAAPGTPVSQTERVILALREMLLRGDFAPGERLAELTLVRRLNASRTPVRLALDRLAREGVLEPLPSGGFRVREFAIADVWDAIEIRGVLEGTAARFAAERLSEPEELLRLRLCCRDAEALVPMTLENFVRYVDVNDAFHVELWRLAKSPMLARAIETLVTLPFASPGALVFANPERAEATNLAIIAIEQFRGIADAIANREGTRAEALAREHARLARRHLATALEHRDVFNRMPGASLVRLPVPIGAL